jgi:hypothetical protein
MFCLSKNRSLIHCLLLPRRHDRPISTKIKYFAERLFKYNAVSLNLKTLQSDKRLALRTARKREIYVWLSQVCSQLHPASQTSCIPFSKRDNLEMSSTVRRSREKLNEQETNAAILNPTPIMLTTAKLILSGLLEIMQFMVRPLSSVATERPGCRQS